MFIRAIMYSLAISFLMPASSAMAAPFYDSTDCTEANDTKDWPNTDASGSSSSLSGYTDGDPIFIYVEQDFGQELKDCVAEGSSNVSPVQNLSDAEANEQAIKTIVAAAEVWNKESLTATLIYAGTVNADDADEACSSLTKEPAIFVRFEERCKGNDPSSCDGVAWASTTKAYMDTCDNVVEIIVWGDPQSPGGCFEDSGGGNPPWDYSFDAQTSYGTELDMMSLMSHEFGHALGLGHTPAFLLADDSSIMEQGDIKKPWIRRHLFEWDNDCADDSETGHHRAERRVIEYRYQKFDSSGNVSGSVVSTTTDIKRGYFSGGYMMEGSSVMYGQYLNTLIRTTSVDTDGLFNFSNESAHGNSSIEDLYISPVLMTTLERSGTNHDHRINYNDIPNTSTDPPLLKYLRSDNYFSSSTAGTYQECPDTTCSSPPDMSSHISLVTAWNDADENNDDKTIFVSVDTSRTSSSYGNIKVYPGFNTSSTNLNLAPHDIVSDDAASPPSTGYTGMTYNMKTDVTPAITCADTTTTFTNNCMLAWVDNGVMDGTILYTYFTTDDKTITWGGTIYTIDVDTVSGISAAYFAGKMWLAYKQIDGDVEYRTSTSTGSWSSAVSFGRSKTVDPPTWLYVPEQTKEAIVIWTEYDSN